MAKTELEAQSLLAAGVSTKNIEYIGRQRRRVWNPLLPSSNYSIQNFISAVYT